VLKKARVSLDGLSDFDMHALLAQKIGSESPLSRRVQHYLDKKYRRQVADVGRCAEGDFFLLWEEGKKSGEIEGLLWVAATNPNLSGEATHRVFADVHMLMHRQGRLVRRELRRVERLRSKNKELSGKLEDAWKSGRETVQALRTLEKEKAELEHTAGTLRAENEALKRDQQSRRLREQNDALRAQLENTERRFQAQACVLDRARDENDRLAAELASQREINQRMRTEMEQLLDEMLREEAECETCLNRDLCDRCVLLVGGITKLRAFYRDAVEEMGGEFKYHDGDRCDEGEMKSLIGWADVVLCPVDVNSHGACLSVKRICKRMNKPYHMLRTSSISTLSRTLHEVAQSSPLE
jgi:hypothetical protein